MTGQESVFHQQVRIRIKFERRGKMDEGAELFRAQECLGCRRRKDGAHYNLFQIVGGVEALREFFGSRGGVADELNFLLCSTSGVHGTYTTIEEIEETARKYGWGRSFPEEDEPDDFSGYRLTVLIAQPRICCLRYGSVELRSDEDVAFLKKLRAGSIEAVQKINAGESVRPPSRPAPAAP
jgi:hypothetical protein